MDTQHDEEYEASTQGGGAWRDRLAQRHRFGRALDLPPPEYLGPPRALIWASLAVWACIALVVWALSG
jgi:hypothetical protein